MSGADPIPAIREQDAEGETAAVFADLRQTLHVPFVNLIWRHLATMPGMLGWTWSVVKPLHGTEALDGAVRELLADVQVPEGIGQPACVFDAVGVGVGERGAIGTLLRDYTAANAVNLLCLLVVRAILEGGTPGGQRAVLAAGGGDEAGRGAAVPLPGMDALTPTLRALVLALDGFGRVEANDAVASLYRHLGHWPGFLSVAHAALSPAQASGTLREAHLHTRERARALAAARLMPVATAGALPAGAEAARARESLTSFTDHMIARMVMMGTAMAALLPEGEA